MKTKKALYFLIFIFFPLQAAEISQKRRRVDSSMIDTSGLDCSESLDRAGIADDENERFEALSTIGVGLPDPMFDVNLRIGSKQLTPLEMCGKYQIIEFVKILLERNANPNDKHPIFQTNCIHDFVEALLKNSSSDYQTSGRNNPFSLLRQYGADFNMQDINGDTPLHLAVTFRLKAAGSPFAHTEYLLNDLLLAHWLLNEGANPNIANLDNNIPVAFVDEKAGMYEIFLLHENLNPGYYEHGDQEPFKNQLWCQVIIDSYLKFVQGQPQNLKEILHSPDVRIQNRLKFLFKKDSFPEFLQHMNKKIAAFENFQVGNACKFGDQEVQYRPGF